MLVGTAIFAQAQIQIKYGAKIGVNAATMNHGEREDKNSDGFKSTLRANIGLAADIKVLSIISVAPEISYSQKGYSYSFSGEHFKDGVLVKYSEEENFKTGYIDMPVLIRGTFGSVIKGYVNAGPTFSYWLDGRYKGNWNGTYGSLPMIKNYDMKVKFVDEYPDNFEETEDIKEVRHDHANRLELGASFGGGLMLPLLGNNILIDARYTMAMKDMYNAMEDRQKARNRVLTLSAIFLINK